MVLSLTGVSCIWVSASGVVDENDGENDATDNGVFGVDISKEALLPTLEDNVSKHGFNRICMIDFVVMNHYCEGCFFVLCFFHWATKSITLFEWQSSRMYNLSKTHKKRVNSKKYTDYWFDESSKQVARDVVCKCARVCGMSVLW